MIFAHTSNKPEKPHDEKLSLHLRFAARHASQPCKKASPACGSSKAQLKRGKLPAGAAELSMTRLRAQWSANILETSYQENLRRGMTNAPWKSSERCSGGKRAIDGAKRGGLAWLASWLLLQP